MIRSVKAVRALLQYAMITFAASELNAAEPSAETFALFESKIRPLLAENCFECHGPENQKGKLRLDSRDAILMGGEHGPAVILGQPEESRLIHVIRQTDPDVQAPHKKSFTRRQIADLAEWIRLGAPWPASVGISAPRSKVGEITDEDRAYWAFQPVQRPQLSEIHNTQSAIRNSVDTFILAALQRKEIQPNPPTTKRQLIRRAYFDLIGLPPTFEQVNAFERDLSPDAYEKLLDHLLSLPQYGE